MSSVTKSTKRPPQPEVVAIKKLFMQFDADHDQGINPAEFQKMIKDLGIHLEAAEATKLFTDMDVDKSGKIELSEFIDHWEEIKRRAEQAHEDVKKLLTQQTNFTKEEVDAMHKNFQLVSKRIVDDGVIDQDEFKQMMVAGGTAPKWNTVLLDGLWRMFDIDTSGGITFEEFVTSLSTYHGKLKTGAEDRDSILFGIYDVDKDKKIGSGDLQKVMLDCLKSNNINLDEAIITELVEETLKGPGVDLARFKELAAPPAGA